MSTNTSPRVRRGRNGSASLSKILGNSASLVALLNTATATPFETKTVNSIPYHIFKVEVAHTLAQAKGVRYNAVIEALGSTVGVTGCSLYVLDKDTAGVSSGSTGTVLADVVRFGTNNQGTASDGALAVGTNYRRFEGATLSAGATPVGKKAFVSPSSVATIAAKTSTLVLVVYAPTARASEMDLKVTFEVTEIV